MSSFSIRPLQNKSRRALVSAYSTLLHRLRLRHTCPFGTASRAWKDACICHCHSCSLSCSSCSLASLSCTLLLYTNQSQHHLPKLVSGKGDRRTHHRDP